VAYTFLSSLPHCLLIPVGMSGTFREKTAAVCLPEFILQNCSLKQLPFEGSCGIDHFPKLSSPKSGVLEKSDW
jgi:hypothetical protein